MPRGPWHSTNGWARKSQRQLPDDVRDCPPPSSPAPVCCKIQYVFVTNRHFHTQACIRRQVDTLRPKIHCYSYHKERFPSTNSSIWGGTGACWCPVYSCGRGGHFTHHTAAGVLLYLFASHRHHGHSCRSGKPVGLVIAAGIVTDAHVAVEEGHGAEQAHAGACLAW